MGRAVGLHRLRRRQPVRLTPLAFGPPARGPAATGVTKCPGAEGWTADGLAARGLSAIRIRAGDVGLWGRHAAFRTLICPDVRWCRHPWEVCPPGAWPDSAVGVRGRRFADRARCINGTVPRRKPRKIRGAYGGSMARWRELPDPPERRDRQLVVCLRRRHRKTDPGAVEGVHGPWPDAAATPRRKPAGLPADGAVGPHTRRVPR
jgi:hypothetical protein